MMCGITEDIRAILRVANLLEIYEFCEKRDNKRFKLKKRLRKSNPKESLTSGE
ncbi:MAG: hypothetical protein KAU62_02155 [Candidatus Heimdallarchaeota archaeon]|nr:hypothetical protein [Candidatus Heimdallarchaeota archaeon]MCK4609937.1 hypothetical protein [Candidatus Heimdallarchaeota archaeon]